MNEAFTEKLKRRINRVNSLLCVGLDPHAKELFPQGWDAISEDHRCEAAYGFCKNLIDTTAPHAACFKPNSAFFEALGSKKGTDTLKRVIQEIPGDIPILLDVKRGDIGSTAAAYADACFRDLGADAVTLSPLMGWDSISPFVTGDFSDKGAFLLCKTSNPGSEDLLALGLAPAPSASSSLTLYEKIAQLAGAWSRQHRASLGLVVGATDIGALEKVRKAAGTDVWILAPGVGAQGGDIIAAATAGLDNQGLGLLIPVSRGISKANDPAQKAKELKEKIEQVRQEVLAGKAGVMSASPSALEPYQVEFLEFSLAESVLKFGSFVLKSGRTSPYFFNAGLFASGAALFKLGKAYASAIMSSARLVDGGKPGFDVVFGPAYKGISLGAVVCAALFSDFGVDVGFAYNRKEAKDHGEGGKLVGAGMEGKRILIVDDVITAGTAIRESYAELTEIGGQPIGVAIALDRAEKRSLDDPISAVQAVARDLSIPVVSIVDLPQLQAFLERSGKYDEMVLESVVQYRTQYGV